VRDDGCGGQREYADEYQHPDVDVSAQLNHGACQHQDQPDYLRFGSSVHARECVGESNHPYRCGEGENGAQQYERS
jgi:hypothetical protein